MTVRHLLRTAIAPFLYLALSSSAQTAGVLCVDASPCIDANALPAFIEPADRVRTFRWIRPSGQIVLGIIPPRSDRASATQPVRLRLISTDSSRWPAPVNLTIRRGESVWRVPLSAAQAKEPIVLRLDPGSYSLRTESARHRLANTDFTVVNAPVDRVVKLYPRPHMTAHVTTKKGDPVPGATAALPSGEVLAVADGTGRLAFDLDPEQWPDAVAITAAGFGTATVSIPRARVDADLLEIALHAGSTIDVALERTGIDVPVKLELYKRRYDVRDEAPLATRSLNGAESTASFDGVASGAYVLVARGPQSHQRYGIKFTIAAGEAKKVVVPLRARTLSVQTLYGEGPLEDARVELFSLEGLWREAFRGDEDGRVRLELWQLGSLSATVAAEPTLTVPFREARTFNAEDDAEWTIRVSTREIHGRIVDASSGAGVKEANVALQVRGQYSYSAVLRSDTAGRFRFTSAVPGDHTVSAAADGYQHDSVRYQFLESEQTHELTLELAPAAVAQLIVRDSAGQAVAGATVLDFAGHTLTGERQTGPDGELAIPLPPGESRNVYVVPRDGSFAIGTVRAGRNTITVPHAASMIVVTSRTTAQQPIPDVWVVLRYNGIVVPFEVQQALARQQGAIPVSGADGRIVLRQMPLGAYEMWPAGSAGEVRAALAGLGPDAPVKIVARPGLNEAVLQFAPTK